MATYASLTQEQKDTLAQHQTILRSTIGELARMLNHARIVDDFYNASASAIIATLDPGELIPNPTGAGDAVALTESETITLESYLQAALDNASSITDGFDATARRQLYSKAAGPANLVG